MSTIINETRIQFYIANNKNIALYHGRTIPSIDAKRQPEKGV